MSAAVSCLLHAESALTSPSSRELGQAQGRVVRGDGFEGDVAVPRRRCLLLRAGVFGARLRVELLVLERADGADFGVAAAKIALGIQDRVDVKARSFWLAGQLAQALDEDFLDVVRQIILRAEEYDSAFGY